MADPAAATQPAASAPPAPGGSVASDALKALQGTAAPAASATPAATPPAPAADPKATAPTPATAAGEIKLTVPKDSGLTEDHVKGVAEFAKAHGLSQAQAEKVLERDAASTAAGKVAAEKAVAENIKQLTQVEADGRAKWAADPVYGGPKLQESNIDVARVLSKAPPGLQAFLAEHPAGKALGSDPLFLSWMADLGRNYLREDAGGGTSTAPPAQPDTKSLDTMAKAFYPNGPMASPKR